ncbi:HK97-gp10 family putative phage morphogenesis protein [Companilactobacillus mishanensis]|uniref:HK97 gp10 family phage protein n=1 Tax=Companilactobacillus mishanensis TaxID=2486008 RepID=A0A5P0ZGI5_9LACO|nr:HK97-gp10 family putative phage morphogenesis protein [Companilactobacillus mishanensis]MQS52170.1 HK97 gp10 family phage protein [Companilactobacillus mishanensis]
MTVTGIEEMLEKAEMLDEHFKKHGRAAVREGGKAFKEKLAENTPVSDVDHSGKGPLKAHTKMGSVTRNTHDEFTVKVGYDKQKGTIARFPNFGTSKQDPQHFIEETQDQTREQILQIFKEHLEL